MEKSIFSNNKFNAKYNIIGDFDLFLKISLKKSYWLYSSPIATYRMHNNNYSNKNLKQHIIELENWLSKNEEILKKGYKLSQQKIYLLKLRTKLIFKKFWVCSSVVERYVDIVEVISSILITPTKSRYFRDNQLFT